MATVAFSLFAASLWGVSDFRGGVLSRRLSAFTVLIGVEMAGLAGSSVALAISGAGLPSLTSCVWAIGAGIAGAFGLVLLFQAMAVGMISIVAPISACGAGLPVIVGLATGERPGPLPLIGIFLGLAGCFLASREQDEGVEAPRSTAGRTAIALALLAAVGIGIYLTGMHYATDGTTIWWPLFVSRLGSVSVAAVALSGRGEIPHGPDLLPVAFVGLADFGGALTYAAATSSGLLALAAVLASLYPAVSVILARLTLHERMLRIQLAGITLAVAGACLMATY